MAEIGWASLGIVPTLDRRFDTRLASALNPRLDSSGRAAGRRFGSAFGASFATVAGVGLGAIAVKLVKDSVTLEATYSKTMRQIGVAASVPTDRLAKLDDLAIKLGNDTIFSANDAAAAMLELAKNGIKPATIEAGALSSALTLATAGGIPLEQAAVSMGNALNAFGLKGRDATSVAAALAGAANASSASVGSLAEGLQQSSAVAADAGLSVQETTAALAAFANAGISGSDAGTSLKTMLTRLVPQTKKAREAMRDLGLDFTDSSGTFIPITKVAAQLKDKLGDLSDEERTTALNTIFGSDARRAATVLMNEGAKGLGKYIKATSDQTQADKLAQTAMDGTSGALERLKGNIETAELQLGKGLAPVVEDVSDGLSNMLGSGDFEKWGQDIASGLGNVATDYAPLGGELRELGESLLPVVGTTLGVIRDALEAAAPLAADLVGAFNDMPEWAKKTIIAGGLTGIVAKKTGVLGSLTGGGSGGLLANRGSTPANALYVIPVGAGLGGAGDIIAGGGKGKGGRRLRPGKAGAAAVLAAIGFDAFGPTDTDKSDGRTGAGGLVSNTLTGAAVGSLVPGPGTAAGAFIGFSKWLSDETNVPNSQLPIAQYEKTLAAQENFAEQFGAKSDRFIVKLGDIAESIRLAIARPQLIVDSDGLTHSTAGGHEAPVPGESSRRRGGTTINVDKIVAADHRDVMGNLQRLSQQANLGGRPAA